MAVPVTQVTMVVNRSASYIAQAQAGISAVVRETAFALEAAIKANIVRVGAVDTGNLLNSVHSDILSPTSADVGTGVDYARHVNSGTYKMAARPFFEPAVMLVEQFFKKRLAEIEPR